MMVFEGVVQQISYTDVLTNNVGTLVDPTQYAFGEQHFTRFFQDYGNIDLCEVKQMCLVGFQRLIIDVFNHR